MSAPGSLFDTSVWIALAFSAHPFHAAAQAVLLATSANTPALFCRATQQSFLRLLTTDAIARAAGVPARSNHDALTILDGFMAFASVGYVEEPKNIFARWRILADLPSVSPKRWMDAYLAAFAMEAGLRLVTCDAGFNQFAGLDVIVLAAAVAPAAGPGGATP